MFTEIAASASLTSARPAFIPSIDNRECWNNLDYSIRQQLVHTGELYLDYCYPQILATDYMEFSRTGNRSNYQEKSFRRRIALNSLVLAECTEDRGRFMDDIINGITLICEESAWQIPAHNAYIRDTPQFNLPDITRPIIDLFAAETAAVLSVVGTLLRPRLKEVSPFLSGMMEKHLNERIIEPYLKQQFWWMGDGHSQMNNWTVWCTQNVLLTAFNMELPADTRQKIVTKACQSVDYFLDEYGEDGCCDEGAGYYRHAGLCLFNIMEILNQVTDNAFLDLYREPKIRNIAAYIRNVHVNDLYYINFADCSAVAGRCNAREFLFGKRTGNPALMAFAAADYKCSEDPLLSEEQNLYDRLQAIFQYEEITNFKDESLSVPADCFYESTGLWIARDNTFCLAVKAGDNNDSHNHNDTGSFTLYRHGLPMFIDVGVETYTQKTFSPERYELWPMQSGYHNLLTFDGIMQMDGAKYRSKDVSVSFKDACASISMELSEAYPGHHIGSYRRNVVFTKNEVITITDTFQSSRKPVVLSLMTYDEPTWHPAECRLQIGTSGSCRVRGVKAAQTERIPITDERLALTWKHDIYRTLLTVDGDEIQIKIS